MGIGKQKLFAFCIAYFYAHRMRSVTLQRMEVFRAIFETESISGAARRLGLSQPTVSRHLKDFQAAMDTEFFVFIDGRMQPTSAGRVLYRESDLLREGADRVEKTLQAIRRGSHRPLSLCCVAGLAEQVLSGVIAARIQKFPDERFDIAVAGAAEQIRKIRESVIDLGVMIGEVSCNDLTKVKVGQGHYVLVTGPGHRFHAEASLTWEALLEARHELASLPQNSPMTLPVVTAFPAFAEDGRDTVILRNLQLALPIAAHLGIPHILDNFSVGDRRLGDCRVIPIEPALSFPVWAVHRPGDRNHGLIRDCIQLLRRVLAG